MAKYVAAGFFEDAEKLLNDFVEENSYDFSVFAEKWKKHTFVLVYLGRDEQQITLFTNEIFQVTLGFLSNTSFLHQVGVCYLLYALHRFQIQTPFVPIRVTLPQFEIFKSIRSAAVTNRLNTLHYVTDYLYSKAFDFVAFTTVYGPVSSRTIIDYSSSIYASSALRDIKSDMKNFHDSNVLEGLRDLNLQYSTVKDKLYSEGSKDTTYDYDEYIKQLNNLVNDVPMSFPKHNTPADPSLGSRRHSIKERAFQNKASYRQPKEEEDSESKDVEPSVPINIKKKRVPKGERKKGRPRKQSVEPSVESATSNKGSASEKESPRVERRGKRKRLTCLEDYNVESALKPKKLPKKKKRSYSSESSEDDASRESQSYDSEDPTDYRLI